MYILNFFFFFSRTDNYTLFDFVKYFPPPGAIVIGADGIKNTWPFVHITPVDRSVRLSAIPG